MAESATGATREFLGILHPESENIAPRRLLIWTLSDKVSHWFETIGEATAFASKTAADAVYFGLGLASRDLGPHQRCKSGEISVLPGFGVDLDVAGPAHGKAGLPPTKEDARRILPTDFPPTLIVDSGHGLQAFWLFKEAWVLDSDEERQRAASLSQRIHRWIEGRAVARGYAIDSVYDLARVFRLVGSVNKKVAGDHRLVRVIENGGRRYDPTDLEGILDFAGVEEVQVLRTDYRGRVEQVGDLRVVPGVELAPSVRERLNALLANDAAFADVWNRRKRMPRDSTWSGYAQSIANVLALVGFTTQEMIDILTVHRREHGDPGKTGPKPLAWFVNPQDATKGTIQKAAKFAREQQAKEAKREKKAKEEAAERQAIATAELSTPDDARSQVRELYGLDAKRLVQVGDNLDPAFRLELEGGRRVDFPSLAAISSFYKFRQYVWLALGRMLPSSLEKKWPEVATLLGRLKEVEDVGGGSTEILLNYLGQWLSGGRKAEHGFFRRAPAAVFSPGPFRDDALNYSYSGIAWAASASEFVAGLKIMTLPQGSLASVFGVCWPNPRPEDPESIRVVFKLPPFIDHIRTLKHWTKDAEAITKLLNAASFVFRDSAKIAALLAEAGGGALQHADDNLRLRRTWAGWISDAVVEEHEFVQGRQREDACIDRAIGRVQ